MKIIKPITIELDIEEVLTITTVFETFRQMTHGLDIAVPEEAKKSIANVLVKMIKEMEKQTDETEG